MELYKQSGKTKTGEVASSRPLGAFLISVDKAPADIANEKISIFIERANGGNTRIATKIPLLDFALASSFGSSAIRVTSDGATPAVLTTLMYCEITEGGAIELGENERVKIELEGLNSAKTYQINGIEMPAFYDIVTFDRKQVLAGEQSRKFNVMEYEHVVLSNTSKISEIHITYTTGTTTKYNFDELQAIGFDVDPVQIVNVGAIENFVADRIVLPLVDVETMDIYKNDNSGVVDLVLRNDNDSIDEFEDEEDEN